MQAKAKAGTPPKAGTTPRGRAATPPPRSKAASPSVPAKATPPTATTPKTKLILGLHPQAFYAVVVVPLLFFGLLLLAAGPGRVYIAMVYTKVGAFWTTVSKPVQQLLVKRADMLVAIAATAVMSPLILLFTVTTFRAARDLQYLNWWQKLLLATLILTAVATTGVIFSEKTLKSASKLKAQWDTMTGPLTSVLAQKADFLIAGSAALCFFPLVLAMTGYALRAVWGCRVKLVIEEAKNQ